MVLTPFFSFAAYALISFTLPLTVQVALVQTFQELLNFLHGAYSFLFSQVLWILILFRKCCIIFLAQVLPLRPFASCSAVQIALVQAFQELFNFLHCFFLPFVFCPFPWDDRIVTRFFVFVKYLIYWVYHIFSIW